MVAAVSVPVAPADIGEQMERFGAAAYVLSVRDDATPHAAQVQVRLDGDVLRCGAGRSAAANVAQRPGVSLLWLPFEPGGYSMIVDATARTVEGPHGLELELRPASGVLHRPAPPSATPQTQTDSSTAAACTSDCAPFSA